jgi:hypothetical protein
MLGISRLGSVEPWHSHGGGKVEAAVAGGHLWQCVGRALAGITFVLMAMQGDLTQLCMREEMAILGDYLGRLS